MTQIKLLVPQGPVVSSQLWNQVSVNQPPFSVRGGGHFFFQLRLGFMFHPYFYRPNLEQSVPPLLINCLLLIDAVPFGMPCISFWLSKIKCGISSQTQKKIKDIVLVIAVKVIFRFFLPPVKSSCKHKCVMIQIFFLFFFFFCYALTHK